MTWQEDAEYAQVDHALRSLLFGSGDTTSGYVKGEEARLNVSAELNRLQDWRREQKREIARLTAALEATERERDHWRQSRADVVERVETAERDREHIFKDLENVGKKLEAAEQRVAELEAERKRIMRGAMTGETLAALDEGEK